MMKINVLFSTNYSERNDLKIEEGAIEEFTRNAHASGNYGASVTFECMPRAFDPEIVQFLVELKDDITEVAEVANSLLILGQVCKAIISFCKRIKGYEKHIIVDSKKSNGEIIVVEDEMTADDLERQMKETIIDID